MDGSQSFYCDFSTLEGWTKEGDGSLSISTGNLTCTDFGIYGTAPSSLYGHELSFGPILSHSVALDGSFTVKTNMSFTPMYSRLGSIVIALISNGIAIACAYIKDNSQSYAEKRGDYIINGTSGSFMSNSSGTFSGELTFERDKSGLITLKLDGTTRVSATYTGEITSLALQFCEVHTVDPITSMYVEDVTLEV